MSRLRSLITFFCIATRARTIPLPEVDDDDDDCWEAIPSTTASDAEIPISPSAAVHAPYKHPQTPAALPSQHPHSAFPTSHPPGTPIILGTVFGIIIAFVVASAVIWYVIRYRASTVNPNSCGDPPRPGTLALFRRFRSNLNQSVADEKRLSDESWVSPVLPPFESPGSPIPFSHDLEFRRCGSRSPQRKLVPVTTPVCTPTDTDFGSRVEFASHDLSHVVPVPPIRVPSPVYIPPLSSSPPSPSLSSVVSLSPSPSTEPLAFESPLPPPRLSRLLSSTFGSTRRVDHLSQPTTARLRTRDYGPRCSLSTTPAPFVFLDRIRSRNSLYPSLVARDTFSTATTMDTDTICTAPHLLRAVDEGALKYDRNNVFTSASASLGTWLGFRVRLSDASEHARYRVRELERQRERSRPDQRLSAASIEESRRVFKLRDSESVLRETGW